LTVEGIDARQREISSGRRAGDTIAYEGVDFTEFTDDLWEPIASAPDPALCQI